MAKCFTNAVGVTIGTYDDWAEIDFSQSPYELPVNATGVMLLVINSDAVERDFGARMKGSTDSRINGLYQGTQAVFYVGVDVNKKAELYVESSDVAVKLLGYFEEEAVFKTNAEEIYYAGINDWYELNTYYENDVARCDGLAYACIVSESTGERPPDYPGSWSETSAWQGYPVTDGGDYGAAILEIGGNGDFTGARKTYSSESPATWFASATGAVVQLDGSGMFEISRGYGSAKFNVVGFLIKPEPSGLPIVDDPAVSSTGVSTWQEGYSGEAPDGTKVIILRVDTDFDESAARKIGSTDNFFNNIGYTTWWPVALSGYENKSFELKGYGCNFWHVGFLGGSVAAGDETGEVEAEAVVTSEEGEQGLVEAEALVTSDEDERGIVEAKVVVKALLAIPTAPAVYGKNPAAGETCVALNRPVGFYIGAGNFDEVDISTVTVSINGTVFDFGDPEFTYTPTATGYWIEVAHPAWQYEEVIAVLIDATSVLGEPMSAVVSYGFLTGWDPRMHRVGLPRIELYKSPEYGRTVLTIQENWVRQGMPRQTTPLELWYGRYMKLPYSENMELQAVAGATNAAGKEVLDNGWLSVGVDREAFQPMTSAAMNLGPMYTHTKKDLQFKLSIPNQASTTEYFTLELRFTPKFMRAYGTLSYGVGIYLAGDGLTIFNPTKIFYRAYVLDDLLWAALRGAGAESPSSPYRGENKRW